MIKLNWMIHQKRKNKSKSSRTDYLFQVIKTDNSKK